MQITCPSCGKSHDTALHRGAFEIECDCGYSILIPDEEALSQSTEDGGGFHAPPIAMDEEDEGISVDVDSAIGHTDSTSNRTSNPFAPFDGAVDMTPESELPSGMLYDPDEAQALAASKDAWSQEKNLEETFLDPFEDQTPLSSGESDEPVMPDIAVVEPAAKTPAQSLVRRNQSAALGHLVGSLFDLSFGSASETQLVKLAAKSDEILKTHPWIEQLCENEKSACAAEDFVTHKKISRVPEVLALEIFLYCFEIGAKCSFASAETLEGHPS